MKKDTHPPYQETLFVDTANGTKFVCGSALQTKDREEFEGKEYPVYKASITSASHPFFTGTSQFIDTEGRVDKFLKKYAKKPVVKKVEASDEVDSGKKESAPKKPAAKKVVAKKPAAKKAPAKKKKED